jgi:hypothetical protein
VATVKARAFRDVWNVAAVIPVEKNAIAAINHHQHYKHNAQKQQHHHRHHGNGSNTSNSFGDDDDDDDNKLPHHLQPRTPRPWHRLLKRTRKGNLPKHH